MNQEKRKELETKIYAQIPYIGYLVPDMSDEELFFLDECIEDW